MKRIICLVLTLMAAFVSVQAQQATAGSIRGTILTNDGQAAPYVSVSLKDRNRGVITDEKGEFLFRRVQPGPYTVQVSLVGYAPAEQTVHVEAGKTASLHISLTLSDTQLDEVTIQGQQEKLSNKKSDYVARLPLKNIENPQVYATIGKALMREQVVTSFDDALKNAPGVNRLWSSTGRPNDGAGYFSMRGFATQPTMVNGIAGVTNGTVDPANVERIEAIKGPSGTLYGSSLVSFGGLINIVTKKPYETFGGELTYTGGSYSLNRFMADVNAPLDKERNALLRVNAAYHYEGSFQDAGFKRSLFFAPSFSYKANDRLSFLINTEFYQAESTNALMVFLNRTRQLIARNPSELGIDFNRSFTSNDITYKTPTVNLQAQANYKLSSNWTSQTVLSRGTRKSDGYYSYVMFLDAKTKPLPNDSLLSRYVYTQGQEAITTDIQQNFIGDFKIGSLRNRVVFGLDYMAQQWNNNNSPYIVFDTVNAVKRDDPAYYGLNRPAVDKALAASKATPTKNYISQYTYSAYVSDVLNITEALSAMLSLRVDYFDYKGQKDHIKGITTGQYTQTAFSPKFGLNYQIVPGKVAVFANYMNGFKNTAPPSVPTDLVGIVDSEFKPQQANQIEGGVKLDLLKNMLSFSASYYDIKVTNMTLQTTYSHNGTDYNISVQDGTQRSRGFEADLVATPLTGLNLVAGYGYNDSKMTEASTFLQGRRPTSAGPEHLANFWASYTVTGGKLKGFGAGFGGNYASENIITNDSRTGLFTLPSYTVLNGTIFYQAAKFRVALKVDNIADEEYFGGWTTVEKQMPRRISANIGFRF
ncbi:TonB-dependent siderophore receptor [Chitinophaga lutea]